MRKFIIVFFLILLLNPTFAEIKDEKQFEIVLTKKGVSTASFIDLETGLPTTSHDFPILTNPNADSVSTTFGVQYDIFPSVNEDNVEAPQTLSISFVDGTATSENYAESGYMLSASDSQSFLNYSVAVSGSDDDSIRLNYTNAPTNTLTFQERTLELIKVTNERKSSSIDGKDLIRITLTITAPPTEISGEYKFMEGRYKGYVILDLSAD